MMCPHCGGQRDTPRSAFVRHVWRRSLRPSTMTYVTTLTPPLLALESVADAAVPSEPRAERTPATPTTRRSRGHLASAVNRGRQLQRRWRAGRQRRPADTPRGRNAEPGMRFGRRYHLIRSLGEGGMGAVYQAWDEELAVVVAIKVIRPETLKDAAAVRDFERRFKRELLLARNVTHKNVVRIHDLGEVDGIKYITMPYVHGSDLAKVIRREGRLPVPRALEHCAPDRCRSRCRARSRHRASRSQAWKHPARRGGPRSHHRLRYRALGHGTGRRHDCGHGRRHARVHGARAGAGR